MNRHQARIKEEVRRIMDEKYSGEIILDGGERVLVESWSLHKLAEYTNGKEVQEMNVRSDTERGANNNA